MDYGLVDPNSIVIGYINAARRLGAVCLNDWFHNRYRTEKDTVHKVLTSLVNLEPQSVVNACGLWITFFENEIGLDTVVAIIIRETMITIAAIRIL